MAITTSVINQQALEDELGVALKAAIIKAAEPHIQAALAEIEAQMRERVVQFAVGSIQKDFDFMSFGEIVTIRIRQGKGGES